MATRYTFTDKWKDSWFVSLAPSSKLTFLFLCDDCDIAGFWEINTKRICDCTGITTKQAIAALKETEKAYVSDGKTLWLKNFLYYQKNLPLNPNSTYHKGIIRCITSQGELGRRAMMEIERITAAKISSRPAAGGKAPAAPANTGNHRTTPKTETIGTSEDGTYDDGKDDAKEIISVWNRNFPDRTENTADVNLVYAVVSCLHNTSRITTRQHIIDAINNYKSACDLPDSQAWKNYRFYGFLQRIGKYWPEVFNLENFRKTNFSAEAKPKVLSAYEKAKAELKAQGVL